MTNRNIICHQHETPVKLTGRLELEAHMQTQHREGANKFQVEFCIKKNYRLEFLTSWLFMYLPISQINQISLIDLSYLK